MVENEELIELIKEALGRDVRYELVDSTIIALCYKIKELKQIIGEANHARKPLKER